MDAISGLPESCRHTWVRHITYALLDAAAAGILSNVPLMALKGMGSPEWEMAVQMAISSVGLFLAIYLGGIMAERRKMPFVVVPGFAFAACTLGMMLTDRVLLFLILSGLGALFETVAQPAITAVIRQNYPATHRGAVTGSIRGWCSIVFLVFTMASALLLDRSPVAAILMIKGQLALAAVLSVAAFCVFATIRVNEAEATGIAAVDFRSARPLKEALRISISDVRFRRYLAIGLLYTFGGMIFASFIPVLVGSRLGYGYLASAILVHVLPSALAFLTTGSIGRWIDRTNPWRAWRWIRLGWGLDPLLLAITPLLAALAPPLAFFVALLARASRGVVMGGSWILWWQVGVTHFAPPGKDTTRYQGMALFVNGLARLVGPVAGAWLLQATDLEAVLLAGGALVLLSALLSSRELAREANDPRLATIEQFERRQDVSFWR
jgi:MFS family permease